MIIVRLQGGLGNQMFQYSAGARLAWRHNTTLHLDLSWFTHQAKGVARRRYELGHFSIPAHLDGAHHVRASGLVYYGRLGKVIAHIRTKLLPNRFTVLRETMFGGHLSDALQAPDNSYLIGYWQSEAYFRDIRRHIHRAFTINMDPDEAKTKTLREISSCEAVSVHVRRGDYVSDAAINQIHGVLTREYYLRAAEYIASRITRPHFFVFSDDPAWCHENLRFDHPMSVVTNNVSDTGRGDMRLMSACRHHIIANSSFSWWGAWLNPSATKIVVAPQHWFRDPSRATGDLFARGWFTL